MSFTRVCFMSLVLGSGLVGSPAAAVAQVTSSTQVSADEMATFARAHSAISLLRDKAQAELAEPKNKKDEAMAQVREKLRAQVLQVLKEHQMTEGRFDSLTRLVSADPEQRKAFEAALAQVGKKAP